MCLHIDHWVNGPHEAGFEERLRALELSITPAQVLKRRKPKRAKADIHVFKVLEKYDGEWLAPYQGTRYIIGKTYRQRKADYDVAREDALRDGQVWGGAFHAYTYCPFLNRSYEAVFRAVIPKGALYWEAEDGREIASTQLRVEGNPI